MRKKIKKQFLRCNETIKKIAESNKCLLPLYTKLFLPLVVYCFQFRDYKLGKMVTPAYKKELDNVIKHYMPTLKGEKIKAMEKDILKAYFTDGMFPMEYFLYNFQKRNYWERHEFLSDLERSACINKWSGTVFNCVKNKTEFYNIAKAFFKRDACKVSKEEPVIYFEEFTQKHKKFIVKPMEGTMGQDTFIATVKDQEEARSLYQNLTAKGDWIAEQLIIQHPEMAKWNESCVNTVRMTAFRSPQGCRILQPFIRTGRKGAVVDNAGAGGLFASFDPETGIVTSDGVDEYGGRFELHPDSKKKYKGWHIPQYEQLKELTDQLMDILPKQLIYLAFDFALTEKGWVVVEANSSGQFVGQIAEQKGVKKLFYKYMSEGLSYNNK